MILLRKDVALFPIDLVRGRIFIVDPCSHFYPSFSSWADERDHPYAKEENDHANGHERDLERLETAKLVVEHQTVYHLSAWVRVLCCWTNQRSMRG